MRKLEKRAILCLLLSGVLVLGTCLFVVRLAADGDEWATYYANEHVFSEGLLAKGKIYDRNGTLLLENDDEGQHYSYDYALRCANLHTTGDSKYNIATGANVAFRSDLIGYNFVTGTKGIFDAGCKVNLTIDSQLNLTAWNALAGRNGTVMVYNWKTGEIVCMVSGPGFDPAAEDGAATAKSGAFINKGLSATLTPGSIFKLVTTAAALENIDDIDNWSFTCRGSYNASDIEGQNWSVDRVTCSYAHGTQNLEKALENSCNCAFANLSLKLGPEVLADYTEKYGLTSSYNINGIKTAEGTFTFNSKDANLAWAGIGQYEDLLNPLSMMVYVGSIAGEGETAKPVLIKGLTGTPESLINPETAAELKKMMRNNVVSEYGEYTFPGLNLGGKTGTAEVGTGNQPHSWFTGYCGDFAFIVCVENGGSGIGNAAPIANKVMQEVNKRF